SDVHNYGVDGGQPPGWVGTHDFLKKSSRRRRDVDWVITNPPFGSRSLAFAREGIRHARFGVAIFVRLQQLEGLDRFKQLYKSNPPTLVAQFVERVPLCKGRWDPDGDTATAYCWLVWLKASPERTQ